MLGSVVLVRWLDSSRTTDWTYSEPTMARVVHESVGFLSHETADAINVRPHRAIDADGDEQHVGDMTIPRCCVLSIEVLRATASSVAAGAAKGRKRRPPSA